MKMTVEQNTLPITSGAINPKPFSYGSSQGGPVSLVFSGINFDNGVQNVPVIIATLVETDVLTFNMNFKGGHKALMTGSVLVDLLGNSIGGFIVKFYVDGVMVTQTPTTVSQPSGTTIRTLSWSYVLPNTPVGVKAVKLAVACASPGNIQVSESNLNVQEFF